MLKNAAFYFTYYILYSCVRLLHKQCHKIYCICHSFVGRIAIIITSVFTKEDCTTNYLTHYPSSFSDKFNLFVPNRFGFDVAGILAKPSKNGGKIEWAKVSGNPIHHHLHDLYFYLGFLKEISFHSSKQN